MSNTKLTKDDEAKLPKFKNHDVAKEYFTEKYGDDFLYSNSFVFEKEDVNHYVLILNTEKFNEMQKYKKKKNTFLFPVSDPSTKGFTQSFQGINIWENGKVQVII